MIEIEKTRRALQYIEALANGMDPLTGEPAGEEEIINRIKVSRCLFYVAEVLREQIRADSAERIEKSWKTQRNKDIPTKPTRKKEFYLSPEEREHIILTEDLPISRFVAYVDAQIDTMAMKKLSRRKLIGWLVKAGYLSEVITDAGATVRRPTDMGKQIGIYTQDRIGQYDTHYTVVMYTPAAQRFLLDNLDVALAE